MKNPPMPTKTNASSPNSGLYLRTTGPKPNAPRDTELYASPSDEMRNAIPIIAKAKTSRLVDNVASFQNAPQI